MHNKCKWDNKRHKSFRIQTDNVLLRDGLVNKTQHYLAVCYGEEY